MNEALNGIPLDKTVHLGSHPNYDIRIQEKLNDLIDEYGSNISPSQAYDIMDIINDVKIAIQNNPTTNINNLIF